MTERSTPRNVVAADLFCGAGGLTAGMRRAGVKVKVGLDSDPRFTETYEFNNAARYWNTDITRVSGAELFDKLALGDDDAFMLASCPPCQPFSRQNKRGILRGHKDERSDLLDEVRRLLRELPRKPDYLFMENVPGISHATNSALTRFEDLLYELKYTVASGVVDAADYGVPQHRKRFILLAKRGISFVSFPTATHGPDKMFEYNTVEVIRGYPPLAAGEKCDYPPNHHSRQLEAINLNRIRQIPKNGGSRRDLPDTLELDCHRKSRGHYDVYGRLAWKKPAPTITTKCVSLSNGRFGHPEQDRALTVREAARLQTFPDHYRFFGPGIDSHAKQVGNAVPVLLAEVFTRHLLSV